METNLEKYQRSNKHRIFKSKSAREDFQCACWVNSPNDVKSDHPGGELYKYKSVHWDKHGVPHKEAGAEVWLCRSCFKKMKELEGLIFREEHRTGISSMPKIEYGDPKIYPASATSQLNVSVAV